MTDERYSRQLLFPPIQEKGQAKLLASTVLVVGMGALGTVICNHLVRAGVGHIRMVDRDYVEWNNLQRQMLFDEADAEQALPKAIAAKQKLTAMNRDVQIEALVNHVSVDNIDHFISDVDVVMDGTDNLATRFLLNDACFKAGIPFSYGGVVSARGMTALFMPGDTPCLRCMTNDDASTGQTCDTVGVIGPAVDMIASMEVVEVFKYLTGNDDALRRTLRTVDFWYNQSFDMKLTKCDSECATCQKKEYPALQQTARNRETVMCGRQTVQIHQESSWNLIRLEARLAKVMQTKATPFLLKAWPNPTITFVMFADGRVLVQGTEDPIEARTLYDRFLG